MIGKLASIALAGQFLFGCSSVDRTHSPTDQREQLPELQAEPLAAPSVVIGAHDGPDDDFTLPVVVAGDGTGGVYVYDVRHLELRKYDDAGRFRSLIAKRGNGPGDVGSVSAVIVHRDTIQVWDGRRGRMLSYTLDGKYISQVHTGLTMIPPRRRTSSLAGLATDGDMLVMLAEESASVGAVDRPLLKYTIVKMPRGSSAADTIVTYEALAPSLTFHSGRSSVATPGPHLGTSVLFDSIDQTFVRIDRGLTTARGTGCICIQRISATGDVVTEKRYDVPPIAIGPAVRSEFRRRVHELSRAGGLPGTSMEGGDDWDSIAGVIGEFPAVKRAYLGPNGTLWVNLNGPASSPAEPWLIFDRNFEAIKRLELPAPVDDPWIANGYLWGRSELDDVPILVRTRLPVLF